MSCYIFSLRYKTKVGSRPSVKTIRSPSLDTRTAHRSWSSLGLDPPAPPGRANARRRTPRRLWKVMRPSGRHRGNGIPRRRDAPALAEVDDVRRGDPTAAGSSRRRCAACPWRPAGGRRRRPARNVDGLVDRHGRSYDPDVTIVSEGGSNAIRSPSGDHVGRRRGEACRDPPRLCPPRGVDQRAVAALEGDRVPLGGRPVPRHQLSSGSGPGG